MKCSCRSSSSSLIGGSGAGWEGTALLNHGSFIKFGCIQFTFSVLNFASPLRRELSSQENSSVAVETSIKGPIPHRILKRERDSTSSSTLTVSPSPPPDKAAQSSGLSSTVKKSRIQEDEDDDEEEEDEEEEEEDRDEINDDSDGEDVDNNDDDENTEDGTEIISEDIEMEESLLQIKQDADQFLPESNCNESKSPCNPDEANSV